MKSLIQADASADDSSEKLNLPAKRLPDYWDRIMGDERLGRARSKLSMHELRLLLIHALNAWHGIDWLKGDEGMVIAYCPPCETFPNGRKMIWLASMLVDQRQNKTPSHLRYPATHWMLAPDDPPSNGDRKPEEPDPCSADSLNQTKARGESSP